MFTRVLEISGCIILAYTIYQIQGMMRVIRDHVAETREKRMHYSLILDEADEMMMRPNEKRNPQYIIKLDEFRHGFYEGTFGVGCYCPLLNISVSATLVSVLIAWARRDDNIIASSISSGT